MKYKKLVWFREGEKIPHDVKFIKEEEREEANFSGTRLFVTSWFLYEIEVQDEN